MRAATNSFALSFHLIDHKVQTDDSIEISHAASDCYSSYIPSWPIGAWLIRWLLVRTSWLLAMHATVAPQIVRVQVGPDRDSDQEVDEGCLPGRTAHASSLLPLGWSWSPLIC